MKETKIFIHKTYFLFKTCVSLYDNSLFVISKLIIIFNIKMRLYFKIQVLFLL